MLGIRKMSGRVPPSFRALCGRVGEHAFHGNEDTTECHEVKAAALLVTDELRHEGEFYLPQRSEVPSIPPFAKSAKDGAPRVMSWLR